jgi:hypothetical protein
MHHGSSEEEDSEEEARAQDRRGEEVNGEEDGHRSSQNRQEEIVLQEARGTVPAPSLFPFQNNQLKRRAGSSVGPCAKRLRASAHAARLSTVLLLRSALRRPLHSRRAARMAPCASRDRRFRDALAAASARLASPRGMPRASAGVGAVRARRPATVIRFFLKSFKLRRQQRPQSAPCE